MKWVPVALCGYEITAICSGRAPTLTQLTARHPALGLALVGALAIHLHRTPRRCAHELS